MNECIAYLDSEGAWHPVPYEELIQCKDCKFSMSGIDKYNERYILCQLHERSYGVIDDGFCMWAERKEENE